MFRRFALGAILAAGLVQGAEAASGPSHILAYVPAATDEDGARDVYAAITRLMTDLPPETRLEVIANPGADQVFDITTPEEMIDHPDWRRSFFAAPLRALQRYARDAYEAGRAGAADPANQVGLHEVVSALPRRASEAPEVIVLGSPRHNAANDADNRTVRRFPNDAFLDLPVQVSRFGAGGVEDSLGGLRVHMCRLDEGFVDPRHSDMLERFAALRLDAMGGVLATWTSNLNECLRRAEAERDDGRRRFERRLAAAPAFYDIENVVQAAPTDVDKQLELLRDMPLTDAAKSGLIPDIMAGAVELVSVWVYDTDSEDGDVVRIETDKSAYE
ncbi:MAG: hypothetical protein AAFU61_05380, partial [Pseudomonadota bacterium]